MLSHHPTCLNPSFQATVNYISNLYDAQFTTGLFYVVIPHREYFSKGVVFQHRRWKTNNASALKLTFPCWDEFSYRYAKLRKRGFDGNETITGTPSRQLTEV
jgi:hypothetical protein